MLTLIDFVLLCGTLEVTKWIDRTICTTVTFPLLRAGHDPNQKRQQSW